MCHASAPDLNDLDIPSPLHLSTPAGALDAPAARRNAAPLLAVLRASLPAAGTVLEVGSGTGQHAAAFAMALAPRLWLPTELDDDRRSSVVIQLSGKPETWCQGHGERGSVLASAGAHLKHRAGRRQGGAQHCQQGGSVPSRGGCIQRAGRCRQM